MTALVVNVYMDPSIQSIRLSCINEISLVPYAACFDNLNLKIQYLSWLNDVDNLKLICSPALMARNKSLSFVEESFARFTRPSSIGFFIYHQPDKTFIGTTKLDSYSKITNSAYDGILIGEQRYHGKGLSKLVYQILLSFAFNHIELSQVNGGCNDQNYAMKRTYEKLGYSESRKTLNTDYVDGITSDHVYYSISKDWFISTFPFGCDLHIKYSN